MHYPGTGGSQGRESAQIASLVEVIMNMILLQVSRGSSGVLRCVCVCSVACVQEYEITLKGAVGEEGTG